MVVATPGHTGDDVSLVVQNAVNGTVLVAGKFSQSYSFLAYALQLLLLLLLLLSTFIERTFAGCHKCATHFILLHVCVLCNQCISTLTFNDICWHVVSIWYATDTKAN